MTISALSAYYVPAKWGEGGMVCARWKESMGEAIPKRETGREQWLVLEPRGVVFHQVCIPVIEGVLHYEDLMEYPLAVIERIFRTIGEVR